WLDAGTPDEGPLGPSDATLSDYRDGSLSLDQKLLVELYLAASEEGRASREAMEAYEASLSTITPGEGAEQKPKGATILGFPVRGLSRPLVLLAGVGMAMAAGIFFFLLPGGTLPSPQDTRLAATSPPAAPDISRGVSLGSSKILAFRATDQVPQATRFAE